MKKTLNQRSIARLTGISLVIMAIVAGLTMGIVFAPIFEMSAEQFSDQFPKWKSILLIGTIGWVVILTCDFIATWGLFKFYAQKNKRKAVFMGLFRLIYSVVLLIAIVDLFQLFSTSNEAEKPFIHLQNFQSIWQFGLIFFGVHLLALGRLVYEKSLILKILGALIFIAGIGYVVSNSADIFINDYDEIRANVEVAFILPMIFGELGLAIWLIAKGGK